ncbi:LysR family transcriptional regulator [Aliiruegeria lutimaris]|uniref:LysR substrate binding domain-containing protein n=1 Tax=Aliiruegeria lutimaris TaxID=571298 RepID=A0A1G9GSY5_9RHOB|nr:LysR family transcriptional regulator [Aliiruegeria lutimaris]SDL03799.1 LysR substrate binding domain-containing protein [Aliiruegeria lutimaris]
MVSFQILCCSKKMKSAPDNWSNIRAFLAVVRTGSTLAASRELGVTQPTVARRIDEFEHELGLTLFDRDTRGFHPTPQARKLLENAENVEVAVRSFGTLAAKLSDDASQVIRFSAPVAAISDRIYDVIAEFRAAHPETPVEVTPTNRFVDLMGGDGDITLRITPQIRDDKLIWSAPSELVHRYV